jgi:hypothetical protein
MNEKEYRKFLAPKAEAVKTQQDLMDFLKEIMGHEHNYGTVVVAVGQGMMATMGHMNQSLGLSGHQGSFVGWEIMKVVFDLKGGARLLDFDDMLFPQYAYKFANTISKSVFDRLQSEAARRLMAHYEEGASVNPEVRTHWETIVKGDVPFGWSVTDG